MESVNGYIINHLINYRIIKEKDKPIYEYGVSILILKIVYWFVFLIYGLCFNVFYETVAFLALYSLIRIYAGGYHASSIRNCFIISFSTVIVNGILCNNIFLFEISFFDEIIFFISSTIILVCCPVENKNKKLDSGEKKKYKIYAILILLIYMFLFFIFSFQISLFEHDKVIVFNVIFTETIMIVLGKIENKNKER